jgi:Spy/CpxP family protein refolding chaperone
MKLRHTLFLAAVPVLLSVGATAALAQGFQPDDIQTVAQRGPRGDRAEKLIEQLDLSEEQAEQIRAIREQSRAANEDLFEEVQQAREQMQSLLSSGASNAELEQQHERMQALHQQMGDRRFQTMLQIREVLTPEQQQQLAELMEQRREQFGGRRRGGRPGGGRR